MSNVMPDHIRFTPSAEYNDCRIEQIQLQNGDVVNFKYDKNDNPTDVKFPNPVTGAGHYKFIYDAHSRLKESINYYDNGGYHEWIRYHYDQNERILLAFVQRDGDYIKENTDPIGRSCYWMEFYYDSESRIIKIIRKFDAGAHVVEQTFTYNDQNNLISESDIFDDQVNMRKTSKIWMFLDRDYSINNRLWADEYNNHGLPTKILGNFENNYEPTFLGINITGAIIKYSCS